MTVQMEQSLEGCLSAAAVTVLSAESGGMCLFPCALCAGKLLGEQDCGWDMSLCAHLWEGPSP